MLPIALLVLLPALVLSEPYTLKWNKCSVENLCFCSDSTGVLTEQGSASPDTDFIDDINDPKCDKGGLQNKFFTSNVALFQMEVKDAQITPGNDPASLLLYQGTAYFGCEYKSGEVTLSVPEGWIKQYGMSIFEDRSRLSSGYALCSVKVEKAVQLEEKLEGSKKTTMKLKTSQEKEYSSIANGKSFFSKYGNNLAKGVIKCDPYAFNDLEYHDEFHVRRIMNRDKDELTCANYGESYTMRFEKNGKKGIDIEKLMCEIVDNSAYLYTVTPKDSNIPTKRMFAPQLNTIYCAAIIAEVCQDPNGGKCDSQADPKCPKFTKGGKDENGGSRAATLTCADNKWIITTCSTDTNCKSHYHVLKADPVCKRDDMKDQNSAVFFATHSGTEERIREGARCFTQYDSCTETSNLILPSAKPCDNLETCDAVDTSDKMKLKCQNEQKQMTVLLNGQGSINVTHLECNLNSGLWFSGRTIVPVSSTVRCNDNTTKNYVIIVEGMTDEAADKIIYSGCAGVIVIISLITVVVFLLIRRRHKVQLKEKADWMNMKKGEQLEQAMEVLPQALIATPDTANAILNGLNMIDLLVDMESQNAKAWGEAFKFLARFHGSITRIDHALWHMFSRYMFTQGQKIIDKAGWIAKKRIRKATSKGQIRCFAIRMIAFSLYDPFETEAEHYLADGFRKLGFNAVDQYPHCGLLWSVVMHLRPSMRKKKTDPMKRVMDGPKLNGAKFMKILRDIACKKALPEQIPKEEVIPYMGSIAQQAAFAYGASPNNFVHVQTVKNAWLVWDGNDEGGDVPMSFFEGMCQTLTYNPAGSILDICTAFSKPIPALLEQIKKVMDEEKWDKVVMDGVRRLIYYGRIMDAKRLKDRFLPNKYDEEMNLLLVEQEHFEQAMEKIKDQLRTWFAAETDKPALKKKPDYTIKTDVKLDNRVTAHGVGSLTRNNASTPDLKSDGSKTNSKSSSKSSEHAPDSPAAGGAASPAPVATPPAAAAAAPAAPPAAPVAPAVPAAPAPAAAPAVPQ